MSSCMDNIYLIIFAPKYITNKDTIIFAPKYNEKLNIKLISNYTKLIFSNYVLCYELFMKHENDYLLNFTYSSSKFNQQISNLPPNLTHLTFGCEFN